MRRGLVALAAVAALMVAPATAGAEPRHGISTFGDLKYPADFSHFAYANPDAPKGGRIVTIGTAGLTTFDSFNGYILRGDPAQLVDLLFDRLMVRAYDEPDAVYGLVAQSADVAADRKSVTFALRPKARFSDGTALTAADVVDSFRLIKEHGHEQYRILIRDVEAAEALDEATVRYRFTGTNLRDLPGIVASLPIFSEAWYTTHDFTRTTLEPPLGSGPYRIEAFKQGQFVTYRRRDDYWARDLAVNRGRYNFDRIKLLYFRDRTAELEALKAGDLDLREEFTSKSWATAYDLDAVKEGRLVKEELPDDTISGAQGFFLNMRREKFADPRVRQALGLAFDFEWSNAHLFYGLYKRTQSVFENSAMKATGEPGAEELKLLEPFRASLPSETFGPAVTPPVSDGSGQDRTLLRAASRLLDAAGWAIEGTRRVNAGGAPLAIEFLSDDPVFERIINPYIRNLELLGIEASVRQVEAAQYQERLKSFDFDILVQRFTIGQTPGTELQAFFASSTADLPGSFNLAGVKSPAVDALMERIVQATSRHQLQVAARSLDRVLRAMHFWIPHWFKASHTVAYWDIFGRPAIKPAYERGILDTWWIEPAKAAALKRGP
jgi:microcin C transport system substrate-binding protein